MDDGSGLNQLIPRLKGSLYLTGQKQGLVCVIRQGFRADSLGPYFKIHASPSKDDRCGNDQSG